MKKINSFYIEIRFKQDEKTIENYNIMSNILHNMDFSYSDWEKDSSFLNVAFRGEKSVARNPMILTFNGFIRFFNT